MLTDKFQVGNDAERIAVAPDGERVYVTLRQAKRVDVVQLDYVREINLAGAPSKGRENAPVTSPCLAISSDRTARASCPSSSRCSRPSPKKSGSCSRTTRLLKAHKFAGKSALTAYAAHLQGKFWPVHDEFFKVRRKSDGGKDPGDPARAGVWTRSRSKGRPTASAVVDHVQQDLDEAYRIGVDSVPAVFVNGKRLRDRSYEAIAAAVEKELRKKAGK